MLYSFFHFIFVYNEKIIYMKITIIGAGNMGGAIARGLASNPNPRIAEICVINRSLNKLELLKEEYPNISITQNHQEGVNDADIVILAVKPWLIESVVKTIQFNSNQVIVSVAAGICFETLQNHIPKVTTFYRIIPNTAIADLVSMNIISSYGATKQQNELIDSLFKPLGANLFVAEDKMAAATSIASCGIAYLFKYIQASMQAGVELGLTPQEAKLLAAQAAIGAGTLLVNHPENHPSTEIDKVTTPGGLTIKGINELEKNNFSNTVIEAIKKSI